MGATPDPLFIYDGDCGVCTAVVRRLARGIGGARVVWKTAHGLAHLPSGVTATELQRYAVFIASDGQICRGYSAFVALAEHVPALRLLGLLRWIPGSQLVGRGLYRLFAANRHRISRLAGLQSCTVQLTPKK